ncbi:hypothetical protein OCH239_00725 [Roseivivax halodurans JCM 10272]|uniref:Uncharacterized protein n=1 Tax=Roseivivax halodurans JCM 10272 TaxID=1449350 RepID=X7END3_9RHOB|nr:hypothetical protein OCH239_00725 [Roseivivax halodurans JCM 10272]
MFGWLDGGRASEPILPVFDASDRNDGPHLRIATGQTDDGERQASTISRS